jgi:hypothetical protein
MGGENERKREFLMHFCWLVWVVGKGWLDLEGTEEKWLVQRVLKPH